MLIKFKSLSTAGTPSWLPIGIPINFPDIESDVITINGEEEKKIDQIVQEILNGWDFHTKVTDNSFTKELNDLEDRIFHFFESINLDDICLIFKEFLDEIGYSFVDKHPWTDVMRTGSSTGCLRGDTGV